MKKHSRTYVLCNKCYDGLMSTERCQNYRTDCQKYRNRSNKTKRDWYSLYPNECMCYACHFILVALFEKSGRKPDILSNIIRYPGRVILRLESGKAKYIYHGLELTALRYACTKVISFSLIRSVQLRLTFVPVFPTENVFKILHWYMHVWHDASMNWYKQEYRFLSFHSTFSCISSLNDLIHFHFSCSIFHRIHRKNISLHLLLFINLFVMLWQILHIFEGIETTNQSQCFHRFGISHT